MSAGIGGVLGLFCGIDGVRKRSNERRPGKEPTYARENQVLGKMDFALTIGIRARQYNRDRC
jgi:hypothetical protein